MQESHNYIQQVSGKKPDKTDILSVLVKRTYRLTEKGECIANEIQFPLVNELQYYEDAPRIVSSDIDTYPYKLLTDIIVKGKARSGKKMSRSQSSLEIGSYKLAFLVIGNRKAYLDLAGKINFTDPEPVEEIPLRYDFAYGGRDAMAESKFKLPPQEVLNNIPPGMDLFAASPYRYRRNTEGKGFLVEFNKSSFEDFDLPNLEYPDDIITPEKLVINDFNLWYKMPLPCCTDWVSPASFPRIAYFGFYNLPPDNSVKLPEITKGWADQNLPGIAPLQGNINFRCTSGASFGLQLPFIRPGEKIRLKNIHRASTDFIISLPNENPNIWVDGRKGNLLETKPVIHTIIIDTEKDLVSIVWRGCGTALRPYHDEELKTMPYKVTWNEK